MIYEPDCIADFQVYENQKTDRLQEILAGLPRTIEVDRSGGRLLERVPVFTTSFPDSVFRIQKTVVFVNSKRLSDRLAMFLSDAKYTARAING